MFLGNSPNGSKLEFMLICIQEVSMSLIILDFTVIGAILDRGQTSERKYDADLMKAQFEECEMWNIDSISAQIFF